MNELKWAPPPLPMASREGEDDGAVLRAVRAFLLDDDVIGGLDSDEEESRLVPFPGDSSTDSSGSATEAPPRKTPTVAKTLPARPRMVNSSRVRMKNEIFSLRQKSIALERRLAQIQRDGSGVASAPTDSTVGAAAPCTPWQSAALEQRELLEAAEREREKLRKKVTECKLTVKRVRQFVHRQIKKQPTSTKLLPLGVTRLAPSHLDAPIGYEDISEYLDSMYAQLDSVFEDKDLDSVTRVTDELNKLHVQNEDSLNMSLEFVKSRVLPFDVATTAKAVWFYHSVKAGDVAVQMEEGSQDTDDVLRQTFGSAYTFPHFKGQTHGRSEARRFVDKDRVVILECAIFHRIEGIGGVEGIDGFGVRVLNWTVISPPRDERLRTAQGLSASQIDSVQITMPFTTDDSNMRPFSPKYREKVKEFFVASLECVHAYERQTLDNILLSGTK